MPLLASEGSAQGSASLPPEVSRAIRFGGFVRGDDRFDHRSFSVSPAEAGTMDPQQRLLLEHGYAALHGGGERRQRLTGRPLFIQLALQATNYSSAMNQPLIGYESTTNRL